MRPVPTTYRMIPFLSRQDHHQTSTHLALPCTAASPAAASPRLDRIRPRLTPEQCLAYLRLYWVLFLALNRPTLGRAVVYIRHPEELVHLLQRQALGLRNQEPDEEEH